jgi:hypothetical protein
MVPTRSFCYRLSIVGAFVMGLTATGLLSTHAEAKPRILRMEVNVKLRHKTTTRTRGSVFDTYRRGRKKVLEVKNGPVWLYLTFHTTPPNQFKLMGSLKLGKSFRPIVVKTTTLQEGKPWVMVINKKINKIAEATIRIKAGAYASVKRSSAGRFRVSFKGVSLRRVLKKLAEMNGYQLSLQEGIPKHRGLKLDLSANSRKQLIQKVCQRFRLHCKVMGKVLWVRPGKAPATR